MKRTFKLSTIFFLGFCILVLGLSLRGKLGNPTSEVLDTLEWKEEGPFELSPERGRFALVYSVLEDKTFNFSLPLARFTTPDVAYLSGKYVSLFAPGVSFLVMPGYFVGKALGASQVGTYAVIALFGVLNALLVRLIARQVGVPNLAANVGALVFLFATPAFAYSVSLYQHQISTSLILGSIYALVRWQSLWALAMVWFLATLAVVVDYPNFFLMLPIALYALGRIIGSQKGQGGRYLQVRLLGFLTFLGVVLPLGLFLWYNTVSYNNPLQLGGTLKSVQAIDEFGQPIESGITTTLGLANRRYGGEKEALGFFKTRNLLSGFYFHLFSPDRGVIKYAPIALLGILGLPVLYRRNRKVGNLFLGVIVINLLLYSMWGDPAGGWAFGSRYLVPSYALLGIGLSLALAQFRKSYVFGLVFLSLFSYSVWVNSLGALTTNRNPPQTEVLALEQLSGKEEKFTYERNLEHLQVYGLKSLVFREWLARYLSARRYHELLTLLLVTVTWLMVINFVVLEKPNYYARFPYLWRRMWGIVKRLYARSF